MDIKIKINGKKILPTSSIKYLGIYLDQFLDRSAHCTNLQTKLLRANGMIAKCRHYVDFSGIKTIYHSIFSSHMLYGCQIWGQTDTKSFNKIKILQNNAIRLITFAESFYDHVTPIYKELKLLKLRDMVTLNNFLLIYDYFNKNLPISFTNFFYILPVMFIPMVQELLSLVSSSFQILNLFVMDVIPLKLPQYSLGIILLKSFQVLISLIFQDQNLKKFIVNNFLYNYID